MLKITKKQIQIVKYYTDNKEVMDRMTKEELIRELELFGVQLSSSTKSMLDTTMLRGIFRYIITELNEKLKGWV